MKGLPWWRWINPWLYMKRRDQAYEETLNLLQEVSVELFRLKDKKP